MGVRYFCCSHDLLHCGSLDAEGYVVEYRVIEEDGLLVYVSDQASEVFHAQIPDVCAVEGDASFGCIVISRNEVHERRFSRSRLSYEGDCLALRDVDVYVVEDLLSFFIAERDSLEADPVVETVDLYRLGDFLYVVLGVHDLVYSFHGGESLRYVVAGLRELLQRGEDAVEDGHVEYEGRSVDRSLFSKDQRTSEPEHDHDHDGSEKLAYRMCRRLSYSDFRRCLPVLVSCVEESFLHLVLGYEGLDHAETSEGLVKLGHCLAPFLLRLKRLPLELLSYGAHSPRHSGNYRYGKESELPAEIDQCGEIADYEYRILYQHVQGTDDRDLDLSHVAAHPCDDVSLLLLREKAHRKAQELVVDHCPYVSYDACPERDHDS